MPPRNVEDSRLGSGFVLSLAGRRLRLAGGPDAVRQSALARMCPPAEVVPYTEHADWTVNVDSIERGAEPAMPTAWSCVLGDRGWPRLAATSNASAVGQYCPNDALVAITANHELRRTEVCLPAGESEAARWVDWLVRTYFAGEMFATGWVLLHAAAVCFAGKVVIIGGESGAGKSSLTHLLCRDHGAAFLADDLVFVRSADDGNVQVVGWPTRVSLPIHLAWPADGARVDSRQMSSAWRRERSLTSPAVYCALYGIPRAGSGDASVLLLLDRTGAGVELARLAADDSHHSFMTDQLGLVGRSTVEQRWSEPAVVAALLERLLALRLRTNHVTTSTAEQISPQLSAMLARRFAS